MKTGARAEHKLYDAMHNAVTTMKMWMNTDIKAEHTLYDAIHNAFTTMKMCVKRVSRVDENGCQGEQNCRLDSAL